MLHLKGFEMINKYRTISGTSTAEYKERGSKFLAFAYPAKSEDEIRSCLASLRKKYFDARHHCYAYVLGSDKKIFRANDDGEPNHSAGDPILGQIRSLDLTNVLVVVVRYFGGTKLGVGGLIQAYRAAAASALSCAEVIDKEVKVQFMLNFNYKETAEVMRLLKSFEAEIIEQRFEMACELLFSINIAHAEALASRVDLLNKTGSKIKMQSLT